MKWTTSSIKSDSVIEETGCFYIPVHLASLRAQVEHLLDSCDNCPFGHTQTHTQKKTLIHCNGKCTHRSHPLTKNFINGRLSQIVPKCG